MDHPSADEIYETVRQQLPHISLGTVYRALALLSEVGLIRELHLGGRPKRFDGDLGTHYHVRCRECGEVSDVPLDPDPPLDSTVRHLTEYHVLGHHLEFEGICPRCRDASPALGTKSGDEAGIGRANEPANASAVEGAHAKPAASNGGGRTDTTREE